MSWSSKTLKIHEAIEDQLDRFCECSDQWGNGEHFDDCPTRELRALLDEDMVATPAVWALVIRVALLALVLVAVAAALVAR